MATDAQVKAAIDAVQAGLANDTQKRLAQGAAQQAGSTGNDAKAAFNGEKKW